MSEVPRTARGRCPVGGDRYVQVRQLDAGTSVDGGDYPAGMEYIHVPATAISRELGEQPGTKGYDGRACRLFVNGVEHHDIYPPQPIEESAFRPKLN